MGLLLILAAVVYWQLSRHEREGLLRSKELASTAVVRLFADSCEAPVVFNDEAAIRDTLATLGRNPEVQYAAVWAVNQGKIESRLGELSRGQAEVATTLPASPTIQRYPDRVVVTASVFDHGKKTVAATVVSFSLERENAAIGEVERSVLWVSAGVAVGLAVLLIGVARITVVKPLAKLVKAAEHLEQGQVTEIDIDTRDELGQLSLAFRRMAQAIRSREEAISARNRDMRLVLDNVGQGFITLDLEGRVAQERSKVVDEWFGELTAGTYFWDYLGGIAPRVATAFKMGWGAVQDDLLPLELCLDQLPRSLEMETRTLEFSYRPIMAEERLTKAIVVISDITERLERERAEQTQREMMMLFNRLLSDRSALDEFFAEGNSLIRAIESDEEIHRSALKRNIHTLKGSSALFGLESVSGFCHELEERLGDSSVLEQSDRALLRSLWDRVEGMRAALSRDDSIELDRNDYDSFLEDLTRRVDHSVLLSVVSSWRYELAERRLELLKDQTLRLAERLGKNHIDVECLPTRLRLPPSRWAPFWSTFAHVVRNAVDHGIDSVEERAAANKPPRATITLAMEHTPGGVMLFIRDDGRGINWAQLAERAKSLGLPYETQKDVEEALFAEGVSTSAEANSVSGRGLGMAAVRSMVRQLGGKIEIDTELGRGTRFRFHFPAAMLNEDTGPLILAGLAPSNRSSAIPSIRISSPVCSISPTGESKRPGTKETSLFPHPRRIS